MEYKLPKGWEWKTLVDLGELYNGGTPRTKNEEYWNGDIPWITGADIVSINVSQGRKYITKKGLENSATHLVPKNSILIVTRTGVGKIGISVNDLAFSQDITAFVCNKNISPKYVARYLLSIGEKIKKFERGATIKGITREVLETLQIPLPPVETQKKIVAILEKAEGLRNFRAQTNELTNQLIQSIFLEMFGDLKINNRKWKIVNLKDLIKEFRYGSSKKSSRTGYPILRIPNIIGNIVNLDEMKYVELTSDEFIKLKLETGDILFVRTNGNQNYVGRCAVIYDNLKEYVYASYLIRARLNQDIILPKYLQFYLSTEFGRNLVKKKTKTSAGQFNINTVELGSIPILVPSLSIQNKFIEIINKIEEMNKKYAKQTNEIIGIYDTLIQKAFKGELIA